MGEILKAADHLNISDLIFAYSQGSNFKKIEINKQFFSCHGPHLYHRWSADYWLGNTGLAKRTHGVYRFRVVVRLSFEKGFNTGAVMKKVVDM